MTPEEEKKEELYTYVRDNYWSKFRHNTSILSTTCRQLALGLGGIAWLAKSNPQYIHLQCQTNSILFLVVLFFIFDAAQYMNQSFLFHDLAKNYDDQIKLGDIKDIPQIVEKPGMNRLTNGFFITKLALLALSSIVFMILLWKT